MDRNVKMLLCAIAAVLLLTACRSGGGETTAPSEQLPQQTTAPAVTLPEGEGVEDWDAPIETAPVQNTEPQAGSVQATVETTEPQENTTLPPKESDSTEPPVQNTNPTEPPVQNTNPAEPTEPTKSEPEPPATTQPQAGGYNPADLSYEEYLAMSPAEQQAHYEQFPSLEAYIAWHNAALAEYEENQSSIEVTGGIDIGDFMNP